MSDFEKVYELGFNTQKAQRALVKVNEIQRDIEKANIKISKTFKAHVERRSVKSTKKLEKGAEKAARAVRKIGTNAVAARKKLAAMASKGLKRVSIAIGIASVASLKFARDFNKGMATVATLIPGQTKRINELKSAMLSLSTETGIATADLTQGLYDGISAWGDTADTVDRLRVIAKASQAGLASTSETMGLIASLTEIYGDNSAKATEHLADMAFVANKLAIKAPFAEMAASMGKVAPLAKQINLSQEQMFATMAAAAGVTGPVSEVATQMSSLYTAIIKETPRMERAVKASNKAMGTSFGTAAEMIGKMGTVKFLRQIQGVTNGTKDFQKALGGRKEGLVLALALADTRADKFNEALDEMTNKSGQMMVAHKEIAEGVDKVGFEYDRAKRRIQAFAIRIGDKLLPVVAKLIKRFEPWLKKLEKLDGETLEFYIKLTKWFLILGTGIGVISRMTASVKVLTTALGLAPTAVGGLTASLGTAGLLGALGPVVAALLAAVAAAEMLNDLVFDPAAEKGAKSKRASEDAVSNSFSSRERVANPYMDENLGQSMEDTQGRMVSLLKARPGLENADALNMESITGWISTVGTGKEDPFERTERLKRENAGALRAEKQLYEEQKAAARTHQLQALAEAGGRTGDLSKPVTITNNVTINAPAGTNTTELIRMAKREFKNDVKRATQGIGAGEQ
ncbi:MAG: phage tail tape measure protein [Chloroflexi bacterium]|nr:phage tail tape measure protein [Chloroflexota bacterium]